MKTKGKKNEARIGGSELNAGLGLSYEHKCNLAKTARIGDVWINIKTGRKATITGNNWRGVMLQHETGRKTQKQHHYFAGDYAPNIKLSAGKRREEEL